MAIIYSDYEGVSDAISGETPILKGNVHRLQGEENVSSRPMVQGLARVLVELI
ncbi:hypothetical protein [Nostoc sp.]|uniref:hypothetical protein n=1 Tax=Nostoc sp. TaxID=1180 RepID=UPI002FF6BA55